MGTLLVTVVHGSRRRDLAVRSDVPITDLLGPLVEALADDPPGPRPRAHPAGADRPVRPGAAAGRDAPRAGKQRDGGDAGKILGLAPVCGRALPVERSLDACGVGHGAVLVLIDGGPGGTTPPLAGARPPVAG